MVSQSGPGWLDSCPGADYWHPEQVGWDFKGCCHRSWLWAVSQHIHRTNGKCGRKDNINLEGIVTQGPLKNMEEILTDCSFSRCVWEPPHISTTAKRAKTWFKNRVVSVLGWPADSEQMRLGWVDKQPLSPGHQDWRTVDILHAVLQVMQRLSSDSTRGSPNRSNQTWKTTRSREKNGERNESHYCWVMMENSTSDCSRGLVLVLQYHFKSLSICLPKPWWLDGMVFHPLWWIVMRR